MSSNDYFTFDQAQTDTLRAQMKAYRASLSPYAATYEDAVRKYQRRYPAFADNPDAYLLRSPYMIDVDKVLHNPFYNRATDKTQVFPFYKNDDITRRSLHLQLVSHIARVIASNLKLDLDLVEAIALGHDMGHTPFGHAGEALLNEISLKENRGRYFKHNVHSVRVLKTLLRCNLTLQTFDGVICHCGERDFEAEYRPGICTTFDEFETVVEECYIRADRDDRVRPGTLEGCVVRISDMLAYLGKDRQDAVRAGLFDRLDYESGVLGSTNLDILNRTTVNLVKNSLGCNYLKLDAEVAQDLNRLRRENNRLIYLSDEVRGVTNDAVLREMMNDLFNSCVDALKAGDESHPVFTHHLAFVANGNTFADIYADEARSLGESFDFLHAQIAIDYIASMTDDYFVDLHEHLFPARHVRASIKYHEYF